MNQLTAARAGDGGTLLMSMILVRRTPGLSRSKEPGGALQSLASQWLQWPLVKKSAGAGPNLTITCVLIRHVQAGHQNPLARFGLTELIALVAPSFPRKFSGK